MKQLEYKTKFQVFLTNITCSFLLFSEMPFLDFVCLRGNVSIFVMWNDISTYSCSDSVVVVV